MSNIALHKLLQDGSINEYFHELLNRRSQVLPEERMAEIIEQSKAMTQAGVCSDNDHCNFSLVMMHTKPIAEDIMGGKLSPEQLAEVSDIVYKDRRKRPIDNITNFYKAVHHALQEVKLPMKKMAYPQSYLGIYVYPAYDINKWMRSVKEIYAMSQKYNIDLNQSFNEVTDKWEDREKRDFSHWMKFYSSQGHQKYKTAQTYFAPEVTDDQQEGRGYFVPMYDNQNIKATIPGIKSPQMPDMSGVGGANQQRIEQEQQDARDAHERIEKEKQLRNKIVGRLQAAEKLLSCDDGRDLVGTDLSKILETLHSLKRNVLSLNVSAKTANDLIIREANRMQHEGIVKGAGMLRVLAQDPLAGLAPMPDPMADPMAGAVPEAPENAPKAIEVFKQRLAKGLQGAEDEFKDFEKEKDDMPLPELPEAPEPAEGPGAPTEEAPQEPPVEGESSEPTLASQDSEAAIVVEAQAIPAPSPEPPPPAPVPEEAAIEVAEGDETTSTNGKNVDDIIESALEQVTIHDVIARLESLATIFKHREIAREIGVVDIMMDRLGIAAYFPNLAEAMQKALEANQYSLTRIEDILNKIRGVAQQGEPVDLTPEHNVSPEAERLQQGLETVENKERQRKERRQERRETKEDAEAAATEVPEAAAAAKELREPAAVETAAPTPVR